MTNKNLLIIAAIGVAYVLFIRSKKRSMPSAATSPASPAAAAPIMASTPAKAMTKDLRMSATEVI